jgi:hypothetical protein
MLSSKLLHKIHNNNQTILHIHNHSLIHIALIMQGIIHNLQDQIISGEAFGSGVNSDSGIASILAGLYSSGVLNQQTTNPYAPQGTTGSFNAIPYGQQQESMFSRPKH